MKRILFSAALAGLSLTLFSPGASFAGNHNGKRLDGYNNHSVREGKTCQTDRNERPGNNNPSPVNHQVPEPGTLALLGAAMGAIYLKRKTGQ